MAACTFSPKTNRARNAALLSAHSWAAAAHPVQQSIAHPANAGGSPSSHADGPDRLELLPWDGAVPAALSQPSSPREYLPEATPQPPYTTWSADITVTAGERLYWSALHSMHKHRQQTDQILQVTSVIRSF